MTRSVENDRSTEPANRDAQNISAENVVNSIHAEGAAKVIIRQISYHWLSEVEEERTRQKAELDLLQKAIANKYLELNRLVGTPAPAVGNPFLFLQPFGFTDAARFFGRDNEIAELSQRMTYSATTFLGGNGGVGKTSLLRAALTPLLLKQQHLPLMVSVNREPLEASLKKELLPNIDAMPFLKAMSLAEFIRIVSSALPEGRVLFVLIDDFEEFFNDQAHAEPERHAFYSEWQRSFNSAALNIHWLFCVPSNFQHLLNFFKREVQPSPNTIHIPPFDRASAKAAMLNPARARGIKVDEEVAISVLDSLGGENIDPADLQLVCYMLAGGRGAPVKEWTMEHYLAQGGADGILRDYLDRTIGALEPWEREPAWQALAVLADPSVRTSTMEQLIERLKLYDVEETVTRRVLHDLERNNLIDLGEAFKLTRDSLRPRIEKWKETRSARERAREEAMDQLQSIRNSALRGLVGGVIGFMLFDQILYDLRSLPDFSYVIFKLMLDTAIGALAGLVLVFSVDVSVASYSGPKRWMAYFGGALGGALAFSLGLIIYSNLIYLGPETFLAIVPRAVLEGGLWGAVAGMSTAWTLKTQRPYWIALLTDTLISGLTLLVIDSLLGVLAGSFLSVSFVSIGLAGAVLPGLILATAMIGRRKSFLTGSWA